MKQITCPHCADTYPDFDVAHVCSKGPYAPRLKSKMNERILELAKQAGLKFPSEDALSPVELKFALLIVRECARLAIEKQTKNDLLNIVSKNPAKDFAYALVEHFGVEE